VKERGAHIKSLAVATERVYFKEMPMNMRIDRGVSRWFVAQIFFLSLGVGQEQPGVLDLSRVVDGKGWRVVNRGVTRLPEGDKRGFRFDERMGQGIAWLEGAQFASGVLEFDVRGKDVFQRSFIGIAFRGIDEETYEAIYFRPFNFKIPDSVRSSHSVQYVSHPTHTWQKLRSEKPGEFEKSVRPIPDPNDWFHARVVVSDSTVTVYVNDSKEPSLEVPSLGNRKSGLVGLWVGNGSGGDFANLKIVGQKPSRQ